MQAKDLRNDILQLKALKEALKDQIKELQQKSNELKIKDIEEPPKTIPPITNTTTDTSKITKKTAALEVQRHLSKHINAGMAYLVGILIATCVLVINKMAGFIAVLILAGIIGWMIGTSAQELKRLEFKYQLTPSKTLIDKFRKEKQKV